MLAGAAIGDVAVLALLALVFSRVGRLAAALRPVQVSAGLLLATGLAWFFARVL